MSLSIHQKRKLATASWIILAGLILGPLFTLMTSGFNGWTPYANSLTIGFLIAVLISILELWIFTRGIRRLKFFSIIILRTIVYLILITFITFHVLLISRMIQNGMSYLEVWRSDEFQEFLFEGLFVAIIVYTLSIAFVINFTRLLSRKMGQGVFWSFITGRYYKPRERERIFMFMRIKNSNEIAKKLGRMDFHRFLNDFIYDITQSILIHRGVIYQYVEDEVVVTWNVKAGLKNANCIRTYFDIKYILYAIRERYYTKYGLIPKCEASFHVGRVILGEIGAIKSEIAFYGDVMNTSSRILGKCEQLNQEILISAHLKYRIDLPPIYQSEVCGKIDLKGKEDPLELYSIHEREVKQEV